MIGAAATVRPSQPRSQGEIAVRARELGLRIGLLEPGEHDAITDVPGVLVGHTTLIDGEGPLVVGTGPVRTGVTIVVPHEDDVWTEPVFAGCHRLNGNGELTGLEWVRESGMLGGVIGITNTHSRRRRPRRAGRPRGARERGPGRVLVAAGRGRDVRRRAQRHQRLPRHGGARRRGARAAASAGRSRRATSAAAPG